MLNENTIFAQTNCVCEIDLTSSKRYADSYNEVTLDVVFESPDGSSITVPAFWRGENRWAVRFAASQTGTYRYKSSCSHTSDQGLHGIEGLLNVTEYTGNNPLMQHGRLCVTEDKSHFAHTDGTPFFWLGDSWWMALTERLVLPEDFKRLTADRVNKGFNVIQITAGLYSEMDIRDPRGVNEAGLPFEEDFSSINPAFFDYADLKLQHLVESGLMPCITGSWGYYLLILGLEKTRGFWRYLVARYGAWPVVWCIAGEATMPWYLSESKQEDEELQKEGWCKVASYVRKIDPFGNLVTIHPAE